MASFNDIINLRKEKGLSQRELSEMLHIPLRTWENWESEIRKPPQYLIDLIMFRLNTEFNTK